jgi:hypothetical protein
VHGPGYGLDPEQSFLSMIAGIVAEWTLGDGPLAKITIAERSEKRCDLLDRMLQKVAPSFGLRSGGRSRSVFVPAGVDEAKGERFSAGSNVVEFGTRAEEKPRLFVAMPFAEDYLDEFHIGFCEAANANSFLCERLDLETFVGDVVTEIKRRILGSHGVLALLNDHNPNVFLEIGFALAHNRPTILVAGRDTKLPFDVSGQRCIRYRSIWDLRDTLTREIALLKEQGVLVRSA